MPHPSTCGSFMPNDTLLHLTLFSYYHLLKYSQIYNWIILTMTISFRSFIVLGPTMINYNENAEHVVKCECDYLNKDHSAWSCLLRLFALW